MSRRLHMLTLLPLLAALACDGTPGREVTFRMELRTASVAGQPPGRFTTDGGWEVELDQAWIALGPIYLWEKPFHTAARLPLRRRMFDLMIPTAHAHPGDEHFAGGAVFGEWVDQILYDALAGQRSLGEVVGDAALVQSFTVVLDPPRERLRLEGDPTRGFQAWVSGTATREGEVIPFEGGLQIDGGPLNRRVDGIPVEAQLEDGGLFVVELHLDRWFRDANFSRLEPNGDGPRLITTGSQVHSAWYIGARGFGAFTGRWVLE